tara:strand:+ start:4530 stop:4913 length:384 start_codon:yes stop_codon:yes gene_type:complete
MNYQPLLLSLKNKHNRKKIAWLLVASTLCALTHALLIAYDEYIFGLVWCDSIACLGREYYYDIGVGVSVISFFIYGYAYPILGVVRKVSALVYGITSVLCFAVSYSYIAHYMRELYLSTLEVSPVIL